MEVLKTLVFTGPNRWSAVRTAELHLQAPAPSSDAATVGARFRQRWLDWLPTLRAAADAAFRALPEVKRRADERNEQLARALTGPASAAEIFVRAVRSLQLAAGADVDFVATGPVDESGVQRAAVEFDEAALLDACVATASRWCRAAAADEPTDVSGEVRKLVDLADDVRLGPSSLAILRAAAARGISHRRLGAGSLVQLGEGVRQRRIWTAETDTTSAIAESIAQDKELTKRLLRRAGVPVPLGRAVSDAADAWAAACEIGVPVVVKPRRANHARGVTLNVVTRDEVERAYDWAVKDGDDTGVIVEQLACGRQHRLLVIGGRLIAAARGESEYVVGDGRSTIRELVDRLNADPRRGLNYTDPLSRVSLDTAALLELQRQGYEPESTPPAGQQVLIQAVGDLTTDCTADVHPENAAHVVLAARVVGLDIAGMDVVAEDIRRPLQEQRGAILEVNAGPSLGMHVAPLHGKPQPVGEAVIERLYGAEGDGRIPIVAVTGAGPRSVVVERIERLLRRAGVAAGRATAEAVHVGSRKIGDGRWSDMENVEALLSHPEVEAAVWESRPEQAWRDGLGCSRVDVAVVTASASGEVDPVERAGGVRAVVHALSPRGTLIMPLDAVSSPDWATPHSGDLLLVAGEVDPAALRPHLEAGRRAVFVRGRRWVLARSEGEEEISFADGCDLPEPAGAATTTAVAAAWAAGCVADRLRTAVGGDVA